MARRSAKQRAAARRNLKKARAARKGKHHRATPKQRRALAKARAARRRNLRKPGHRRHRVRRYSYRRPSRRVTVRAHLSREEPKRRRRRSRRRRRYARAAEAPRRRRRRRSYAKRRRGGRRHRGGGRRRGALENPLNGMELFVGGLTGIVGFIATSLTDRAIATREGAVVKSPSAPIYSDYYRLGAAVGFTAIPLVAAHYVRSPLWRSGLQFFGVAALLYLGGKLTQDLGAKMLKDNDTGKRLFGGEIAAQDMVAAADKAAAGTAGIPKGAGAPPCGCDDVPPPPAFTGGQPSPAAMEAVRGHRPALLALGGIAPEIAAMNQGRATAEQIARVEQVQRQYASSLAALSKFHHAELEAAVGLAGISPIANAMRAKPQAQPQQVAPQALAEENEPSPYAWAHNN